jgi:hypothetical protein
MKRHDTQPWFDRLKGTKLRMVSAVGQGRDITYGEMSAMAWQPTTLFYLVIVAVALTVFDVNGYQARIGIAGSAVAWTLGVLTVTLSYNVVLFLWTLINVRQGWHLILMPGVGFFSTFSTLTMVEGSVAYMSGMPLDWDHWLTQFPYIFLVIEVFDVIYVAFAMPVIRAATAHRAARAEMPKPPDEVQLAGQKFRTSTLKWATSQDHYLKLACADGAHMVLARMADLTKQAGLTVGVQPHRSWWVAARAAPRLERQGRAEVLLLDDGTRVPVARSRSGAVKAWLESQDRD